MLGEVILDYDDYVKTHNISNFDELLKIIKGKSDWGDLRENYVFRGMKKTSFKLIPSSLRKDKYGNFEINKFISNDEFKFRLNLESDEVKKIDKIWNEFDDLPENSLISFITNKNEDFDHTSYPEFISSFNQLQFKREAYVLIKFLSHADRIGLDINANQYIRRWIHNAVHYGIDQFEVWPKPEFYEIISIAQHNNLPTRALDWSYDYNIALYFAVSNIVYGDESDCVLWAFNYKLFENHYFGEKFDLLIFKNHIHGKKIIKLTDGYEQDIPPFEIYRPKYSYNDNLKSQQGLFTFLNSVNFNNIISNKSFDEEIVDLLKENRNEYGKYKLNGFKEFGLEKNEKIFHKFVIPGNIKKEIFKELYIENYKKEVLFPQFDKIAESMKETIFFEELLNNSFQKSNVLISIPLNIWSCINNKEINAIHITHYNNELIDKVQVNGEVCGFFM